MRKEMGKDMMRVKDLIGKMKSANTNYVKLYDGITYETVYRGTDKGLFSNYENTKKEVVSFHVENNCLCICVPHEEEEDCIEDLGHGMVLMQNIE